MLGVVISDVQERGETITVRMAVCPVLCLCPSYTHDNVSAED